jgi:small redox-active disulfide protein 2
MKIEVLGTGCAKCKTLEENAKQALAKIGGFHEVKKVEDIVEIMNYGVMSTPALVVDGAVVSSGKLLSVEEIIELLK